jgi:hypothetical protein
MAGLLIEFILIVVILFLELLAELPDHIILELEKSSLLFIVLQECASLGKLSG